MRCVVPVCYIWVTVDVGSGFRMVFELILVSRRGVLG